MKHDSITKRLMLFFNKFIWLIVIIVSLIGFNGYLSPTQLRVFGDSFPVMLNDNPNPNYEYYFQNFDEARKPFNNTPFRYQLESARYTISLLSTPQIAQWITVFVPLIVSFIVSFWFFKQLADNNLIAFGTWFAWTFSTFALFTASIHTHIIIAINLMLVFSAVFHWFLKNSFNRVNFIFLNIFGALVLILAMIYEMRMVIVTSPFFIAMYLIWIREYFKDKTIHFGVKFGIFLKTILIYVFLISGYFNFLFLNIRDIYTQVGTLITRGTWGNPFFQIINSLTIYHPFWNFPTPKNFIYHFPEPIYFLNLVALTILAGLVTLSIFKFKSNPNWLALVVMSFSGLFFLFFSKQNNFPIENVYDIFYRFPYFSFSREASKYYYGFWLSMLYLIIIINKINFNQARIKQFSKLIVILIVVPTLLNFGIFGTRIYGKNTIEYQYDISVYSKINRYFESVKKNEKNITGVLWLPTISSLQKNTETIKHFPYFSLIANYPLNNMRKNDRDYLFKAFTDPNFSRYLDMYGIEYVVFPDEKNDAQGIDEITSLYKNFNYSEFKKYSIDKLDLNLMKNIDGYEIFTYKRYPLNYDVVETVSNYKQVDIGDIVLKNKIDTEIKYYDELSPVDDLRIREGNCNNNSSKNLDFKPAQRIRIDKNTSNKIKLEMSAKFEEVPCVFFEFKNPNEDLYFKLDKYQGDPIELILFNKPIQDSPEVKRVFNLDTDSIGHTPINCDQPICTLGIYLYGDKATLSKLLTFEGSFVKGNMANSINKQNKSIKNLKVPINSLNSTSIDPKSVLEADYILIPYNYDPYFRLNIDGKTLSPVINNHNILLFQTEDFKNSLNIKRIELRYPKEVSIQSSLTISSWFLYSIFLSAFISSFYFGYKYSSAKRTQKHLEK